MTDGLVYCLLGRQKQKRLVTEPKLSQPRLLLEEDYNVKAAELRSFIVELTPARHHGVKTATAHFSSRAKINKNRALIVPNFL